MADLIFNETQLVLLWKCRQLGVMSWNKDHTSQSLQTIYLLRDGSEITRYVHVYINSDNKLFLEANTNAPGTNYSSTVFYFDDDAGFLTNMKHDAGSEEMPCIVIGTGDIRHLNGEGAFCKLHPFLLTIDPDTPLVLSCEDDYSITVHHYSGRALSPELVSTDIIIYPS